MVSFVVPLSLPEAANAEIYGPKAANQAALGLAGLPIPICEDCFLYKRCLANFHDGYHSSIKYKLASPT